MTQPKKLIEVALPIKEISSECLRDDRIQHGHISSLHKWWARRPLPVCRAVVFASLVPDPSDKDCPQAFKDAVEILLGSLEKPLNEQGFDVNAYKPYYDIPYTAANDKMDDTLRNRILMFIGKYSNEFISNERAGKTTSSGKQLSDLCLIKWDNKNNEAIINKARKLIWVAHNSSKSRRSALELLSDFDKHYKDIKDAEYELYSLADRHIASKESKLKSQRLESCIEAFLLKMPKVFDPFAGGGAIPLETARLGCRSYGNDINPVAHIIQKGSLEFPQKYGKPITYSKSEFVKLFKISASSFSNAGKSYGGLVNGALDINDLEELQSQGHILFSTECKFVTVKNRLSFDFEFYANRLLEITKKEVGYMYPIDKKANTPICYYWAKTGVCENPSCKAEVPLLRGFYLANTDRKQVYLEPIIKGTSIRFEIKNGGYDEEVITGWNNRGNLICPCCGSVTDVKKIKDQNINGGLGERLIAVIIEGKDGKEYRQPTKEEIEILEMLPKAKLPTEKMQRNSAGGDTFSWGITMWGQLFSNRQLLALYSLIDNLEVIKKELTHFEVDYQAAIRTFLAIWIDRMAARMTRFGLIDLGGEKVVDLFGRQAIPMVFDYPEMNLFKLEQISWVSRYINSEGFSFNYSKIYNSSSGEKTQFEPKSIDIAVTDPPYYDAMAYADLSDFFYVWLKRSLMDVYPINFATPQTPKSEECTALKHHHNGSIQLAKKHFENKLLQIFDAIEHQTSDLVTIMFAHQSTEAWSTLCNSILGARMNITGSWAIDTEKKGGLKTNKSFLSSSVTVACRPSQKVGFGDYKEVKKAIEKTVANEVAELYRLGFRGADLLTACFGQAVSEFGKYEKVEKANGSEVAVTELLEMARESAFNALLKGFDGDDFTKFYIGWLQLYGFTETDFDDAAKFSRVGLSINVSDLFAEHILIKNGNKQTLGTYEQRIHANKNLGERADNLIIDLVHRAMALFKSPNRVALLQYLNKVASQPENSFWRVVTSLCEVLPNGSDDFKQAIGLITNKDSLIKESKNINRPATEQAKLEF